GRERSPACTAAPGPATARRSCANWARRCSGVSMSVPRENLMQIEPYLSFDGNCEEALQFYRQCLGGEIVALHRYEGSPMDTPQLPAEWKKRVMHATFEADGHRLMASDRMPGQQEELYAGFSLSINIPKDAARARQVFDALAEGG